MTDDRLYRRNVNTTCMFGQGTSQWFAETCSPEGRRREDRRKSGSSRHDTCPHLAPTDAGPFICSVRSTQRAQGVSDQTAVFVLPTQRKKHRTHPPLGSTSSMLKREQPQNRGPDKQPSMVRFEQLHGPHWAHGNPAPGASTTPGITTQRHP